jgi:hypothetical protein
VDWVSLAPDRKVWKAPLNMVMALKFVEAAVECMPSGASITSIFNKKKTSVNF